MHLQISSLLSFQFHSAMPGLQTAPAVVGGEGLGHALRQMMNSSVQYYLMLWVTGVVPLEWIEYGMDLYHNKIPYAPYSIYLRGTISSGR